MEYELDEGFQIKDDKLADWAIRKIREEEDEKDRLVSIAQDQIAELNLRIAQLESQCTSKTSFLKGHLALYFDTVPHKQTKTQETYKLLSGSLVMKKASTKINHDDEKLLTYLEGSAQEEFIKTKKSVDWAEYKKQLIIQDGKVVDKELGVVLDNKVCSVEDVPASFDIKF